MNLKPIAGYDGYFVSDCGVILSEKTGVRKVRRGCVGKDGYTRIILARSDRSGYDTKYVHRLVAEAFVEKVEGRPDVNHIDHNKLNNCASNLEWVTHKENLEKAMVVHGKWRVGGYNRRPVRMIMVDTGEERVWASAREAAIAMGNSKRAANISVALHANRVAYGARWRFVVE